MMNSAQFDNVNGLSNIYWGWGGEDDDLSVRVKSKGNIRDIPGQSYFTQRRKIYHLRLIGDGYLLSFTINVNRYSPLATYALK